MLFLNGLILSLCLAGIESLDFDSGEQTTDTVVSTPNGQIRGAVKHSWDGIRYYSYRGIRYAEAPVKQLRFKPPVPARAWDGILNATHDGPVCVQSEFFTQKVIGDEDCLMINVYTPQSPDISCNKALPVMVWIHGGGFFMGTGASWSTGPGRFMDQGVVVATINYRLGPLGFLSTGDNVLPGNYGLLDQVEALRWVQKNIESFGGNPNQVTIFGESAGAGSVALHLLSPLSTDLFHGIIAQSGSALCTWAIQENFKEKASKLAKAVDCMEHSDSSSALVQCLMARRAKYLVGAEIKIRPTNGQPTFAPVVDYHFLPNKPAILLARGQYHKVPAILGINKDEGIMFYGMLKSQFHQLGREFMEQHFGQLVFNLTNNNDPNYVTELQRHYFTGANLDDERDVGRRLIEILGDIWFRNCHYRLADILAPAIPTYLYSIEYRSPHQTLATQFQLDNDWGISHADELPLIFEGRQFFKGEVELTDTDKLVSRSIIKMWTDFAKHGVPVPRVSPSIPLYWQAAGASRLHHLRIAEILSMQENPSHRHEGVQQMASMETSSHDEL